MGKLSQDIGVLNEADRVRVLIDSCEKALASLVPESARQLMVDAGAAHHLLEQLTKDGADMRGEATRLETIDDRILHNARLIMRLIGGRPAFLALRDEIAPGTAERQWMLDRELDFARQRFLRTLCLAAAIVAVILLAGYLGRSILFPPDPVGDAVNAASRAIDLKNSANALAAINSGLTVSPTSIELLIWKGVLEEKSGNAIQSQTDYGQALAVAESDRDFYLQRALIFVRMGDSARVISDTNTIIAKYPNSAEAYYVRATGYEGLGDRIKAINDLDKCGQLAQAAGNDTLFAQARVRMGTLMQAAAGQ